MSQGFTASGNGFDMLSTLTTAETAITGADTALISKMNVCNSGASYAVTLPAATGNTGKICGIRIKEAVTGLITLTCTGAEKLYGSGDNVGSATRVMWAGESAILLSDGTNWYKISGKTIAMYCDVSASSSADINPMANGAVTKILFTAGEILANVGGMADAATDLITVRRAGVYSIHTNCGITLPNGAGASNSASVGIADTVALGTMYGAMSWSCEVNTTAAATHQMSGTSMPTIAAGTTWLIWYYAGVANCIFEKEYPHFIFEEKPTW